MRTKKVDIQLYKKAESTTRVPRIVQRYWNCSLCSGIFAPNMKHKNAGNESERHDQNWNWATEKKRKIRFKKNRRRQKTKTYTLIPGESSVQNRHIPPAPDPPPATRPRELDAVEDAVVFLCLTVPPVPPPTALAGLAPEPTVVEEDACACWER